MTFYLGTHQPGWLNTTAVELFISDRRLRDYRRLPRAASGWSLDSGGFTELSTHGTWSFGPSPAAYAARVRRYADEIGNLRWATPQDWMCEPWIVAKTGLTVADHQQRTVANLLQLREAAPDVPWAPVVQGWTVADYLNCVDLYQAAGVDLTAEPVVGVGSVCRRQGTQITAEIMTELWAAGVRNLHGFGVKTAGLRLYAGLLTSADSMAWSMAARRRPALPECRGHAHCGNCRRFALRWRERVVAALAVGAQAPNQLPLFTAS